MKLSSVITLREFSEMKSSKKRNRAEQKSKSKYRRPKRFGPEWLGTYAKGTSNPNIGMWHKLRWIRTVLGKIPCGRDEEGNKLFDDSWQGFEPDYILHLESEILRIENHLKELRLEYEANLIKENQ